MLLFANLSVHKAVINNNLKKHLTEPNKGLLHLGPNTEFTLHL